MRTCLYQDDYCKLYKDELIILTYFFPTCNNKSIKVKHIRHVYFAKHTFLREIGKVKDWGMAFSPIWWGCDLGRTWSTNRFNVVIDNGSSIKKGFSVLRITEFLNALRQVVLPTVAFDNVIPRHFHSTDMKHIKAVEKAGVAEEVLRPEPEIQEKRPVYFDETPQPNYASAPPAYEQAIAYPKLE